MWNNEAVTPELRIRAAAIGEGIAKRWKFVSAEGGAVVAGLQSALRLPQGSVPAGERILISIEIRNVGPRTRQILDIRGLDIELPDSKVAVTAPRSDGRVIIRDLSRAGAKAAGEPIDYPGPDQKIDFSTGGSLSTAVRLDGVVTLPPGDYEIQFTYYAATKKLVLDADEDLRSNPVRLKVVAK